MHEIQAVETTLVFVDGGSCAQVKNYFKPLFLFYLVNSFIIIIRAHARCKAGRLDRPSLVLFRWIAPTLALIPTLTLIGPVSVDRLDGHQLGFVMPVVVLVGFKSLPQVHLRAYIDLAYRYRNQGGVD